ncbi:hypothetical protein [Burkholderia gladioli]|uniref:hypothetical protein n=1 Tax=Burkholderia gladioli TaxID=28095 RepID=UPI00164229B7|nr:hypothetical protein [Burkholderia gladioli]
MTTNTTAALTDEQLTIQWAIESIEASAKSLQECHTQNGTWGDDTEAQSMFEREMEIASALRALLTSPRAAVPAPEGWKLVPIERSYNMRAKALIAFNTTEKKTNDRDDALDAAHRAMLDAAPAAPVAELVMQPLTDAALREALDDFELVCENNDVRRLTDDEKYVAQEFALSLIHGDPSAAQAVAADGVSEDEPSEIEQVIACLGDDAAKLRDANPDDEMADNMDAAARLLSERAAIVEHCAKIADSFTYGSCGLDGWIGKSIRASQIPRAAVSPATATFETVTMPHKWDETGERCVRCGDKDRMGTTCTTIKPQAPATAGERAAFVSLIGYERPETEGCAVDVWDSHRATWSAAIEFARASQAAAPVDAREPHVDDVAVDEFAIAMKAKMAAARAKGRSGWETCAPADLSRMLREHVEKGDPRDVANFSMMLYHHGAPISAPADAREPVGRFDKSLNQIRWLDGLVNADFADRQPFYTYPVSVPADAGEAVAWENAESDIPNDEREVIVFLNGHCALTDMECRKGGGWGIRLGFYDHEKRYWRVHGKREHFVTHWRDLPDPPDSAVIAGAHAQGAQGGKGGEA